jgi:hypothetical protein
MKCQMCLCVEHFGPNNVDLGKAEQTDIAPELKDWREFASVVGRLNEDETKFKVVRCGASFVQMQGQPSIALKSYVGFCFAEATRNKNSFEYYELFHFLSRHFAERPLSKPVFFMFNLKQTDFNGDRVQGYSVDFHVQGHGDSRDVALEAANAGYSCLSAFLDRRLSGTAYWPQ